jgi:transaldolase
LWASTSTKNAAYPDTLYVDRLIGPDTINTLTETAIAAFEDHGIVAKTIDEASDDAEQVLERLETIGVSMTDVGRTLEEEGAATFTKSFDDLVETLESKRAELAHRPGGTHTHV